MEIPGLNTHQTQSCGNRPAQSTCALQGQVCDEQVEVCLLMSVP